MADKSLGQAAYEAFDAYWVSLHHSALDWSRLGAPGRAAWEAAATAAAGACGVSGGGTQEQPRFPLHARYAYPDAGWEGDRKNAAERLTPGRVYTVRHLDVGGSVSYLTFQEVGGQYNTVLFEPVTGDD
jgi:hypothetical protein